MKKIIYLISLIVLFNAGCSDEFLDRTSLTSLANETFWTNEADAMLGLMGVYSAAQQDHIFDSQPWGGGSTRWDHMSDNGYTNWQWMQGGDIARGEHTTSSGMVNNTWNSLYVGIVRANTVIEKVSEMNPANIDAAVAQQIIAEASVLRATFYNILAILWKDAPLITEIQNVEEAKVDKNSRQEIVDFIVSDLEAVYNDLPVESDWGRITRGAALATLARINLFHGDYTKAAGYAQDVIDLGIYSLFPDYSTLFKTANEQNDEIIWSVQFDRLADNGSGFAGYWGAGVVNYQRVLPNLADEYYMIDGLPYDQSPLFNSEAVFENRDPRFSASILTAGDLWRGEVETRNPGQYFMRKYTEEENNENHFDSPQDFYVIRYGHVLLMRAEALLMSGSYTELEVVGLIDQLRARVGMPLVAYVEGTGLSQSELLDIVKHERRVETAFEGLRYFDLMRWEELEEAYAQYMAVDKQRLIDVGAPGIRDRIFNPTKDYKWPIPQNELDVNENLSQHTEWLGY